MASMTLSTDLFDCMPCTIKHGYKETTQSTILFRSTDKKRQKGSREILTLKQYQQDTSSSISMSSSAAKCSKTKQKRDPRMTMFSVPNNCCHPSWASFAQITTANPKPRQFALRHGASSLDLDRTNSGWKTHRLVGTPTGKELRSIPVYCIKPGSTWTICCSQYSSPWCLPKSCPSSIPISTLTSNNCLNPIGHSQISDTTALPCQMKIAQHRWSAHKLLTSKWLQFAPPILLLTSPHHDALRFEVVKPDTDVPRWRHHRTGFSFWTAQGCPDTSPSHETVLPVHLRHLSLLEALEELHPGTTHAKLPLRVFLRATRIQAPPPIPSVLSFPTVAWYPWQNPNSSNRYDHLFFHPIATA